MTAREAGFKIWDEAVTNDGFDNWDIDLDLAERIIEDAINSALAKEREEWILADCVRIAAESMYKVNSEYATQCNNSMVRMEAELAKKDSQLKVVKDALEEIKNMTVNLQFTPGDGIRSISKRVKQAIKQIEEGV